MRVVTSAAVIKRDSNGKTDIRPSEENSSTISKYSLNPLTVSQFVTTESTGTIALPAAVEAPQSCLKRTFSNTQYLHRNIIVTTSIIISLSDRPVVITSIYRKCSNDYNQAELEALDFNTRHPLWGNLSYNSAGGHILELSLSSGPGLVTPSEPIHFHYQQHRPTIIEFFVTQNIPNPANIASSQQTGLRQPCSHTKSGLEEIPGYYLKIQQTRP
ncbi:hypothetical protein GWI33_019842 [Rhynchophorus ferrugineus]|uniref:Uncharacterized protein n=1 Tax=Rhynchophorus ferrugineus TaxID=354439 RepID=A0A834HVI2_RHYFE|nr:hypothetical protein GWI33_019842 [Rhynchophorus ferrugineus]